VSDEAQAPAPGEPRIGDVLAGYRLDELIGRGGMAIVYRAYDERLGRSVALKVLAPRLALDTAFRQRFIRESRVAASVDHPNIIPIYEAGEADGFLFIAMRFVQGRDVLTVIEEEGALPAARACHIVTQVAAALDAAHERGLVHRDVKPANMLRDAAGEDQPDHVYLSDFGLSKHWLSSSTLTSQGEFLGTMDYVAPEQIEGNPVDGRADQYALACSAFEMLSGSPPFRRDETMAIMWAQVSAPPPALTSRRPDLPAAVDPVLAKALAKAPDERYRTCLEFAGALRGAVESTVTGPLPGEPGRPSEPGGSSGPAGGGNQRAGEPAVTPPPAAAGVPSAEPAGPSVPGEPAGAGELAGAGEPAGAGAVAPGGASRRTRVAVLAACVVLLGAIGAGYALFGTGSAAKKGTSLTKGAALTAPGCTTKTATARTLAKAHGRRVTLGGRPLGAVVTSQGYGFVALSTGLGLLRTAGTAPALQRTIPLSAPRGLALTHDQKYLLVAGQAGVTVFRVSDLENGLSAPAGTLTGPAGSHAVQVAVSPFDKYALATFQSGRSGGYVAVFNVRQAVRSGFGPADRTRLIPMPEPPAGIAISPQGLYAYVASGLAASAGASGHGQLTVISMLAGPNTPAFSVVKTVGAGCGPNQVLIDKYSQNVWVTVAGGNALVAYSAAKLLSDPRHALLARVAVGGQPLGLVFYDHGQRIMVADAGRAGGAGNVAVVDVSRARPALLGTVATGTAPQQVALYPGGKTLLVADTGSRQLQVIKVSQLP
jgi:DNA-binding beta-propeller fold protein YncE/tRNA A-37 threonylcarbamoyl transferase component Bud32